MVIMQTDTPTFAVLTMVFLLANFLANGAQQKRVIPGPKGASTFSDGIVVGNTLYIAAQQGRDEHDNLKAGGIGPETQAALEDLVRVVKGAGFEWKDVVAVTATIRRSQTVSLLADSIQRLRAEAIAGWPLA